MKFWFPWAIDALVALVAVAFFVIGLSDGSVSSFNMALWLGVLAALSVVVGGSLWLRSQGRQATAITLAWLLAVPGLLTGIFFLALIVLNPRWN